MHVIAIVINLIYFCLLRPIHGEQHPILYVSANGTDLNNTNCSQHTPCGTLYWALEMRQNAPVISQTSDAEIRIIGFNTTDIMYNKSVRITMSINLTFNMLNPKQLSEWASVTEVSAIRFETWWWNTATISINNLYFSQYNGEIISPFISQDATVYKQPVKLILNNCTFRDIICNIDHSNPYSNTVSAYTCFLYSNADSIEIHESVFSNISGNGPLIATQGRNVIMQDNIFNDLYWINSPILYASEYEMITLEQNTFNDIYFAYNQSIGSFAYCGTATIICPSCPDDASNMAYINNSLFNHVNGPIIACEYYYTYGYCIYDLNVFMNDIVITTSRVMNDIDIIQSTVASSWYFDISYNYDKALIIAPPGTELIMNNVSVTYELMDNLNKNCVFLNVSYLNESIRVECAAPYRFVYTEGYGFVEMNNVYVTNDLTNEGLDEFRKNWIVRNRKGFSNDSIGFTFLYSEYPEISEAETEMIYNNGSQLFVHNLTLYGVGLHERILYNVGVAVIQDFNLLRPDDCKYNSEFINQHECYFTGNDMDNGLLMINDSVISGAMVAIYAEGGNVEIYNTLISDVVSAVYIEQATSFKMLASHLQNIGRYHVAAWVSWYMFDASWFKQGVWLDSINHIVIYNNTFEYFPVNWYVFVVNNKVDRSVYAEISYNEFKNPVTRDTFNIDQFGSIGKDHFKEYYGWNESYNSVQLINAIYGASGVYREDLVVMRWYINSSFVGNIFYKDELMTALESACLAIDVYKYSSIALNSVCIWNNQFYGIAIKLDEAHIISCIYPELNSEYTECWQQFGAFNMEIGQYEDGDRFIATDIDVPLFEFIKASTIILYHATISTDFTMEQDRNVLYNPFSLSFWLLGIIEMEMNATISFLDVTINESNSRIELQFYEDCVNECTQIYQDSMNDIHQFHLNCMNISAESSIVSLSESLSLKSVNHTLASRIFLNSSGAVYPGGALDIDFFILDSHNNVLDDWDQQISISLISNDFNFGTIMDINHINGSYQCDICDKGLYIPNVRMDESLNETYIINANVADNIVFVNNVSVTVVQCPTGYGLNTQLSYCYECNIGECSIKPSVAPCIGCSNELKGVSCIGGDKVIISKNYWVGFDYFGNRKIVSQYCPSNYCNQINNGLYLELYESQQLCALNRDPNVPLCGSCKSGYSELYGSANCGQCTRHRYELLVLCIIIAVLFTLFIIFMNGINRNKHNVSKFIFCFRKTFHINDDAKQYMIMSLKKPISYHYQSVTFILLNGGIFVHFSAFAEIFNFQFDFGEQNTNNVSGYCVFNGITAKYEIISRLLMPFCCILTLFFIMIIYKSMGGLQYQLFGRQIYFGKSTISVLLLSIGSFCGVCLKLISCRNIGRDYSVHFYFGIDECYDSTWYIGLILLNFFVVLFCTLFIKLYIDHKTKDIKYLEKDTYCLESLVKSYKIDKYWYWEIILFSRRLLIAMLTIITESIIAKNILFVLLSIYLCAQMYCNPFKMHKINILETMCLLSLLMILYVLDHSTNEQDNNAFSIILLNILLIFPSLVWIIQLIQTAGPYNPLNHDENDPSNNDENDPSNNDKKSMRTVDYHTILFTE